MKTEKFDKYHAFLSSGLKEMVVGGRYQYKEDWHIYHFIFLGWDETADKFTWYLQWDDGPYKGEKTDVSSLIDMTGHYYSGMPHFMPQNSYMSKYNQEYFSKKFNESKKREGENSQKS